MLKQLFTLFCLLPFAVSAQFSSGFENIPIDSSLDYYAGSASSSGFSDNGLFFRNDYNASFQSWNGFALSRKTDSITAGYENQFSCRPGAAAEGSTFALAYASGRIFIRKENGEAARRLRSFRLSNSTYAARSMQFGDAFAKKFGGASGLDPDFFLLKVYNYLNGSISDSASFYLADYREEGSQNDYIVKDWMLAETGFQQAFDSLGFELSSSDNGAFGMNTPAYFCMDQVLTDGIAGQEESISQKMILYPNPSSDFVQFNLQNPTNFRILNHNGSEVLKGQGHSGKNKMEVSALPPGLYHFLTDSGFSVRLMVR